jgi:hypothetical protein
MAIGTMVGLEALVAGPLTVASMKPSCWLGARAGERAPDPTEFRRVRNLAEQQALVLPRKVGVKSPAE